MPATEIHEPCICGGNATWVGSKQSCDNPVCLFYADSEERDAATYLRSVGVTIEPAPRKFQARGFKYYAPNPGQMLSGADLITFAANERWLRS